MDVTEPRGGRVNIGSVYCWVPSGNKSFSEPMLTQIYVAIWRRYAPMSYCIKGSARDHSNGRKSYDCLSVA